MIPDDDVRGLGRKSALHREIPVCEVSEKAFAVRLWFCIKRGDDPLGDVYFQILGVKCCQDFLLQRTRRLSRPGKQSHGGDGRRQELRIFWLVQCLGHECLCVGG